MQTGIVAFLLGVLALMQCSELPDRALVAMLPIVLLLACPPTSARVGLLFAAGFLFALGQAHTALDRELPAELEGESLTVQGRITSLPEQLPQRVRFNLAVREWPADIADSRLPARVRLSWYAYGNSDVPALRSGESWQLRVRLKRPHGFSNPGGFDYEGWLFEQGIRATGYVRAGPANQRLRQADPGIGMLRQWLRERIAATIEHERNRALVQALALGDRSGLTPVDWERLRATGTSHLLAISGLHVGLVGGLVYLLMRGLWSLSITATRRLPAQQAALVTGLLGAAGYAALSGFAIPAQRALIMLAVLTLALLLHRLWRLGDGLLFALLLVVLLDPLAMLAVGLWLSFGAVAVIGWGLAWRLPQTGWWWRYGRTQALIALGLGPLLLFWFQAYPISGFPANLLAVPWVSVVVVPLILAGLVLLAPWPAAGELLLNLAAHALSLLWAWLGLLLDYLPSSLARPQPSLPLLLLALAGAALWLLPRAVPGRPLGLVLLLPLLWPAVPRPQPGEFRLVVLDVGQGLASVIETHRHILVYDTGPRFSERFDAGSAAVVPYLRYRGHAAIDKLLVSHGDNDHIGGAAAIADHLPVRESLSSTPEAMPLAASHCRYGQHWRRDGVEFSLLHPAQAVTEDSNNHSCVLRIESAAGSALLPGDIESAAEYALIRRAGSRLAADVLVAPHHGSQSSSTQEFIRRVDPDYTVFSTGYRNRYDFPDDVIIDRYRQTADNSVLLNTPADGAVVFDFDSTGVRVKRWRHAERRFWHNRVPWP